MEFENSIQCSHEPATGPDPKPGASRPQRHVTLFLIQHNPTPLFRFPDQNSCKHCSYLRVTHTA